MNTTIGDIGDIVEIHNFPEEGDVSKGEIVIRSNDDVIRSIERFRMVLVHQINDTSLINGTSINRPIDCNCKRVNISPTGLSLLEDSASDSKIRKYRFDFRDQANAIAEDRSFQKLM